MAKLATDKNISFVINTGDNFYFNGVQDVHDSRFEKSFENVYNAQSLLVPWYTIAGNHDYLGNVSAQIDYTNYSNIWTYPDFYYQASYKFGADQNSSIDLFMIDTMILCGNTNDVDGSGIIDWIFSKHKDADAPPDIEAANRQLSWLEEQLSKSTADFVFVVGHYPIYSVSGHGPNQCLIDTLDPLLRKYNVSAYFSGHDHSLQHIRITKGMNESAPTTSNYIISGAGSRTGKAGRHIKSVPENSLLFRYPDKWNPLSQAGLSNGGFIHATIKKERADLFFYSGKQEQKYQMSLFSRK
uniref:Tartrate-resistant acid phosphatase type 5 n=1 Tax=Acrobeloides nanus TaxID=290746 RepID=A0A914DUQ1_9BILA